MKTFAITFTVVVNITGVTTCNTSQWRLNVFSTNCWLIFFPGSTYDRWCPEFNIPCGYDAMTHFMHTAEIKIVGSHTAQLELSLRLALLIKSCFLPQKNMNFDVGIFRA